jgi:TRAP-type uncharacterized transport system fused permease subunit
MALVLLHRRPVRRLRSVIRRAAIDRRRLMSEAADAGMTTAEYAVGTLAACAFAGVLWAVVRSSAVHTLLQSVIERALNLAP